MAQRKKSSGKDEHLNGAKKERLIRAHLNALSSSAVRANWLSKELQYFKKKVKK